MKKLQLLIVVVIAGLLLVGLAGCKGDSESEPEPNSTTTSAAVE